MSTLSSGERNNLEKHLRMSDGYVLDFSDRTLGEFVFETVHIDIHDAKYRSQGTSKAKKLRTFCKVEDDYTVGKLLLALIDYEAAHKFVQDPERIALAEKCRQVAMRLLAGGPSLNPLKEHANTLNATHLKEQIQRLEASIESDPSLAIGTAKELIETCCKTILAELGKPVVGTPDISTLTKETLKQLNLVPEGVPDASRGADVIRRLLSNLGTIGNGLAELRGLYGTGHGKHGSAISLSTRHARLAVGAAATLAMFLFETHNETKP
jgi:hypothetical protein